MIVTPAAVVRPASEPVAPGLPDCAAVDLALSFDGRDGTFDGMQHSGTLMVVRNRGHGRCRIPALPRISFAGPGGAALPIRFAPPPGMHPGPAVPPVGLAPGATASAELRWVSGDAFPGGPCYGTTSIRVVFDKATLDASFTERFCGPAAGATFGQSWLKPRTE